MRLSVILPTYNRATRLKRVIAALEHQTFPHTSFEVIVVSDGSTDETNTYLSSIRTPLSLTAVFQDNGGPAAARNAGLARARAETVLFLDDDVIPESNLLEEHVRIHNVEGDKVVVLGPMLSPPNHRLSPWVAWEQQMLEKQYSAMRSGAWAPTARQFYTGNASLRRSHVLEAGGFDLRYRRAEDIELAYRLAARGMRFVFAPRAVGYHYAERSQAAWLAVAYSYGKADATFSLEKGQSWLLPTIGREFRARHPLVRLLTHVTAGRPRVTAAATAAMSTAAAVSYRCGAQRVSRAACSGAFNLAHYQGLADGLGGRAPLLAWLRESGARRCGSC
jgi:glycosyltransferase involved in cell wall biosynthesis